MLLAAFAGTSSLPGVEGEVLGASTESYNEAAVKHPTKIQTQTAFDQKEILEQEAIPFPTEYEDNDEVEYGVEETLVEGVEGTKTLTYLQTYWLDEEIDMQLVSTTINEPTPEKVARGTKVVWHEYMTPDVGGVKYWRKMRVWATKYDANCEGCWGRTFSGTEVVKGVCATDPKVIPLGTNFYVDGYGLCRAEDIGGAIKGDKIDLGYVDASKGEWRTGYTDIYLLTNAPE